MGRKLSSNLISLSVAVAGLLVLGFGLALGWQAWASYATLQRLHSVTAAGDALQMAAADLARERGLMAAVIGDRRSRAPAALVEARRRTDESWKLALAAIEPLASGLPERSGVRQQLHLLQESWRGLHAARGVALRSEAPTAMMDWFAAATAVIEAGAELHESIVLSVDAPMAIIYMNMLIGRRIWKLAESAGQVRAIFAYYAGRGTPLPTELHEHTRASMAAFEHDLSELLAYGTARGMPQRLSTAINELSDIMVTQRPLRQAMLDAAHTGQYPMTAKAWFESATAGIDHALAVAETASDISIEQLRDSARQRLWALFIYLVAALAAGLLAIASLMRVRRNATELFMQKELAETTLVSIGDAVIATDGSGHVTYINPVAERLTGWASDEARGRPVREVFRIYNPLHASVSDPIGACLREGQVTGLNSGHVLIRRDLKEITIEDSAAPIRNREGRIVGVVVVFYDSGKPRHVDHMLSYHATRDALTNLYNRREFERQLVELLDSTRHSDREAEHVLAYIDLDQFKVVNDTCGHTAGDRMLRQVAFLLRKRIRDTDVLARLGGDEFGLLLKNCPVPRAVEVAESLRRAVHGMRFPWEGKTFQVGLSIGIVPITPASVSASELLGEADAACYAAKEKGRNRVQLYRPDDLELARRSGEMKWMTRITEALDEHLFELHCQAIRPLTNHAPERAEILLRLRQAEGPVISPMAFIPAAERYGLMLAVDRWVIEQTCRTLGRNRGKFGKVVFNINLSGVSIADDELAGFIRHQVARAGLEPAQLCFELTETAAVVCLESAVRLMSELGKQGFGFALDDFGAGLSSFTYLKTLPVQLLKIDGSFVRNMLSDTIDRAMVESVANIGRRIGLYTCAEWVENETTLQELMALGIDYAQGYHVHRPVPLETSISAAEVA